MKAKIKSKVLAALICCMLIIGLLPTTVLAASLTVLNVNGTSILSATDNKITCGEGTAEYDSDSNTLTLTNITIEGEFSGSAAIYAVGDLTIRLVGTNTITSGYYGIYGNNGTITIGGEGKLIIQSDNDCMRGDNISIGNVNETGAPTIEAMGRGKQATGIYTTNVLTIQNGAKVTAKSDGDSYALCGEGGITIADSTVNTTSSGSEQNVICSVSDFSIDNSTVTATGTSQDAFPAIFAAGNINITNKSNVEATSSGMRGIFTDSNMTVTDSTVTATGTTREGMVVVGTLTLNNSSLTASSKPNDIIPAIVTKSFNITNSEVTAKGGFDLFDWYNGNIDDISFGIAPANGKLAEFKVDGNNWDGSAAKHFKEGNESPYDTSINFSADEMNWLGAYRYIHIGEHIHTGGTATCTEPTICEDCGRAYGNALGHNAVKTERKEATCIEDGNIQYWYCDACGKYFSDETLTEKITKEETVVKATGHNAVKTERKETTCIEDGNIQYWYCDACGKYFSDETLTEEITKEETVVKATGHGETELKNAKEATCTVEGYTGDKVCKVCGLVVEKGKVTAKAAHNFKDGKCTVCKATDPNYVPTKPTVPENGDKESPQTGDSTNIALWFAIMLTAGTILTGTVLYSKKKKCSK